jgi:hypothetical protein
MIVIVFLKGVAGKNSDWVVLGHDAHLSVSDSVPNQPPARPVLRCDLTTTGLELHRNWQNGAVWNTLKTYAIAFI